MLSDAERKIFLATQTEKINKGLRPLPEHMHEGVRRYLLEGLAPGDFLKAVLADKLVDSCYRADEMNAARIHQWAEFVYNYVPLAARGSEESVAYWIGVGGFRGLHR